MKSNIKIKNVFLSGLIAASALGLIACGKSNTAEVDNSNFYQSCSNCTNFLPPGSGNELIRTVSQDSVGGMQMALSFMYQSYSSYTNAPTNYGGYGPQAFLMNYTGLTSTYGQVTFAQNFNQNLQQNNFCLLPAGSYQVRPLQAAPWNQGYISNLRILLTGPAQVVLNINYAQFSNVNFGAVQSGSSATSAATGRLVGNALVETINGNNCQIVMTLQ